VRELREKRKMTQTDLATAAGMSLPYVSDVERGVKVPSLTTLVRLAVALNCKLTALVAVFDKADLRAMLPK
jgi:transcriptional regulator with XRE-family HTH domain